ncbi:MAG TPA: ATP-binding protein, partial [Allosphingosinicella sp.]|nr:ATP-binding protein [Allosphingosinicella sp.]
CALITATLLYAKSAVFRSRALAALASGYVFAGSMLTAHLLTFPGAFAPGGLLGAGVDTTAWTAVFWRGALPIAALLYVALKRPDQGPQPATGRPATRIGLGVLAAIVLAGALTLLAIGGEDLLPPLMANRVDSNYANLASAQMLLVALDLLAIAILYRKRGSALDFWLLVSLSAWLAQLLLSAALHSRFSVGFYALNVIMLISNLVLMLALIAESYRLHMQLALARSARKREREARLMSMEAVTGAIAHEVGQPLTAATTNGLVSMHWLTQVPPDLDKAIPALRENLDSVRRTSDVITSIRAMFAKGAVPATEVSLNDLVRETVVLLHRELASGKVALDLELDEALPPILADRVQIQRVLLNLFNNAIESVGATHGRPRRISVRSAPQDGEEVLLEFSDTGVGIAPGETEHIFDAFVTTKATGTGLGLSLCRTIVEEHEGRLWASPGAGHGATFHLQLPRDRAPAT